MTRKPTVKSLRVPKKPQQEEVLKPVPTHLGMTLTVATFTSMALVLLILGLEVQVVFLQESTLVSYEFVVSNITALLHNAI